MTVAAMMALTLAFTASAEDAVGETDEIVEEDDTSVEEEVLTTEEETVNEADETTEETVNEGLTGVEDKGADTGVGDVAVASAIALIATGAVIFSRKKK
ncbi:MAG: hypothetical protein FWH08_06465 [Oscillospiraceae bacterium]|nr:hypothetical protein [Oscillospiraceae bacterium]